MYLSLVSGAALGGLIVGYFIGLVVSMASMGAVSVVEVLYPSMGVRPMLMPSQRITAACAVGSALVTSLVAALV